MKGLLYTAVQMRESMQDYISHLLLQKRINSWFSDVIITLYQLSNK